MEGHGQGAQQELVHHSDEMEKQLTQPVKTVGDLCCIQWSPDSRSDSVRSRTNLPQTYSMQSDDVAAERSSGFQSSPHYSPSRQQEKDEMSAHSSVCSSYVGTVRVGVGNYDDNIRASPSWLSNSSVTQTYTSSSWRTYSSSGEEVFGQSRYRTTLSGTWHLRINKMKI